MRITKKQIQTVKRTFESWSWLTEHPDKEKEDYYKMTGIWPERSTLNCFLCDIWNHGFRDICQGCPLGTKALQCGYEVNGVLGSPWDLWDRGKDRPKQAKRIVRACKRWLGKNKCS